MSFEPNAKGAGFLPAGSVRSKLATASFAVLAVGSAQAASVSGQGTWETTLLGRDITGQAVAATSGDAVFLYDTVLDVTWLRDANAAAGTRYDSAEMSSATDGLLSWDDAAAWARDLIVGNYDGWRLPGMADPSAGCTFSNAGGTDCGYNVRTVSDSGAYSELAHLYYTTLGNLAFCTPGDEECAEPQTGWGLTNTGSFQNLQAGDYWTGVRFAPDPNLVWRFGMGEGGYQGDSYRYLDSYALAVRSGDVLSSVPAPTGLALILIGLAALTGARASATRGD